MNKIQTKKDVEEEFKVKLRNLLTTYKAKLSIEMDGMDEVIVGELFVPKLGLGKIKFNLGMKLDKNLKV